MNHQRVRVDWRVALLLLAFVGLTIWVFSRFTNLKDLGAAFSQGVWFLIVIGFIVHMGYFFMKATLYQLSFAIVDVRMSALEFLPVLLGAFFINVVVPSGGAAGGALIVSSAVRRGGSGARAAVGTVLVLLTDLSTLIPYIVITIVYLQLKGQLRVYDTITSLFFVVFIVLLIAALALAHWRLNWFQSLLEKARGMVNWIGARVHHPNLLGEDFAESNAREFDLAAQAIATHPRQLAYALGWAFLMHAVDLASLYAFFLAYHQPVTLGALIAGFSMGIVFWVISIVPQGAAAVEGIMSLVFTSLGIPPEKTVAIVLTFRAANFYLPLIFGFFLLRYVTRILSERDSVGTDRSAHGPSRIQTQEGRKHDEESANPVPSSGDC
jgi:uncharacterized protein (TIRG00374 family)